MNTFEKTFEMPGENNEKEKAQLSKLKENNARWERLRAEGKKMRETFDALQKGELTQKDLEIQEAVSKGVPNNVAAELINPKSLTPEKPIEKKVYKKAEISKPLGPNDEVPKDWLRDWEDKNEK